MNKARISVLVPATAALLAACGSSKSTSTPGARKSAHAKRILDCEQPDAKHRDGGTRHDQAQQARRATRCRAHQAPAAAGDLAVLTTAQTPA